MIHDSVDGFAAALPRHGALMGLDLGTVTIGVAVSDGLRRVASPLETIRRKKFGVDAKALFALAEAREIAGLILGLPLNMDGSEGPRSQSTRASTCRATVSPSAAQPRRPPESAPMASPKAWASRWPSRKSRRSRTSLTRFERPLMELAASVRK